MNEGMNTLSDTRVSITQSQRDLTKNTKFTSVLLYFVTEPEEQPPALNATESDAKGINQDANQIGDEDSQDTSDQGQQTTPGNRQGYMKRKPGHNCTRLWT